MSHNGNLNLLAATDAVDALRDGAISAEQLMGDCLARVREVDDQVQAWAHLDHEHALARARARDDVRKQGHALGPLHGLPVGVKDIIDTADMPTEDGTVLHAGRLPVSDAAVVTLLRAAGAVVTGMVPVAIGSQTNGSVIRPAAYCGIFGFKPTFGLIPRTGVLKLAPSLDQLGVFGRTLEDVALVAQQLVGYDENDPATRPVARPDWLAASLEEPPMAPTFAFIRTPVWDRAEAETQEAFAELVGALGARVEELELPPSSEKVWDWHRIVMEAEMAAHLEAEWERGREKLSLPLQAQLSRGRAITALDYQKARARIPMTQDALSDIFQQCDAILTPAVTGTAPLADSTGDPLFCTLWTFCGMPALNVPVMKGSNGLPLGMQLVGPRHGDARLLRSARWLISALAGN